MKSLPKMGVEPIQQFKLVSSKPTASTASTSSAISAHEPYRNRTRIFSLED